MKTTPASASMFAMSRSIGVSGWAAWDRSRGVRRRLTEGCSARRVGSRHRSVLRDHCSLAVPGNDAA